MLPDQGRERADIPGAELSRPLWLGQGLLEHQGVDINHTILKQMQREHADLMVLAAIARELAMASEENEIISAIPLLNDVQSFVYLPTHFFAMQISAQEYGLDGFAEFCEGFVRRMLNVVAGEPSQDGFRFGRAEPHRRHILDHLIIVLTDQFPVDRSAQHPLQVLVSIWLAGIRP